MSDNFELPTPTVQVADIKSLVESLSVLLDEELALMQSMSADALTDLLLRKQSLLDSIASRELTLRQLFSATGQDASIASLRELIALCSEKNQRNRSVGQVQLNHASKSLELLRSMLKMNDVPTYGASGSLTVAREKRNFGSA